MPWLALCVAKFQTALKAQTISASWFYKGLFSTPLFVLAIRGTIYNIYKCICYPSTITLRLGGNFEVLFDFVSF